MKASSINKTIIHKMMNRAIQIEKQCDKACRNFQIMYANMRADVLILRWTTIDISDIDNPIQCYRFECFDMDGTPQLCSIYYTNQQEANAFILSLQLYYHQEFAIDHKLDEDV